MAAMTYSLLLALAACEGEPSFTVGDTLGGDPDATEATANLSTPYITGTTTEVIVRTYDNLHGESWRIVSEDPNVIALGDTRHSESNSDAEDEWEELRADLYAVGEGQTTLTLYDENDTPRILGAVESWVPDSAQIYSQGDVIRDGGVGTAVVNPQIVTGGQGWFVLEPRRGETVLHGIAAFSGRVDEMGVVSVNWDPESSRSTVGLTPTEDGPQEVSLEGIDGLLALPFTGVPASEIASVELAGTDESGLEDLDTNTVEAVVRDGSGERIYGASIVWSGVGSQEGAAGDTWSYVYRPAVLATVSAGVGGQSVEATIHAEEDPNVDDTDCATVNGRASVVLLMLSGVVGLLRRRPHSVRGGIARARS